MGLPYTRQDAIHEYGKVIFDSAHKGSYYDVECPNCHCWGGKHSFHECRAPGCKCNYACVDAPGNKLCINLNRFGVWGVSTDGGKTVKQFSTFTLEPIMKVKLEVDSSNNCSCGGKAMGYAKGSPLHSDYCSWKGAMMKTPEPTEIEKCKAANKGKVPPGLHQMAYKYYNYQNFPWGKP